MDDIVLFPFGYCNQCGVIKILVFTRFVHEKLCSIESSGSVLNDITKKLIDWFVGNAFGMSIVFKR